MLGIGMQEMLIIGIAALLIFGPGKLPEVMGQAGKLYRDFRNMTSELTGEFEKTVAEAKDAANQLTGDMQKQVNSVTASVQRDLGTGSKVTNTSKLKGATASSSTAKKTSTTSSSKSTTSSSRSTTSSSTSSSRTSSTSTSSTSTAKPAPVVASREDPIADVSVFELAAPERPRRARKATPSVITDPTPRTIATAMADGDTGGSSQAVIADDPLARARQRRKNAGYAQRTA